MLLACKLDQSTQISLTLLHFFFLRNPSSFLFCWRAGVDLKIEEFNAIGERTPLIANLTPHGKVRVAFVSFKMCPLVGSWSGPCWAHLMFAVHSLFFFCTNATRNNWSLLDFENSQYLFLLCLLSIADRRSSNHYAVLCASFFLLLMQTVKELAFQGLQSAQPAKAGRG